MKKNIVIIGAGPAGLSAAYEILNNSNDYNVLILEKTDAIGGISKTVCHNGNRMDIGGHRFFSKDENIVKWWLEMLPMQNKQSIDDILLNNEKFLPTHGANPEKEDEVFLKRRRVSRIFYNNKFFDYPIKMQLKTFKNLGLSTTLCAGFSYLYSVIRKRKENSLEDFYINRFGKKLYSMFFENYTEKLWGRHPKEISPQWGKQRVKGLSILAILKDIFYKVFPLFNHKVETSLIEEFIYPKFGPGQLYETIARKIEEMEGKILFNSKVTKLNYDEDKIKSLVYLQDNKEYEIEADYIISSMPIKDLIEAFNKIPNELKTIAKNLPYRDFITIGILVNKLNLKNETNIKTFNDIIPDCWIYVQDSNVKLGRIQVFNNWSPYLIKDFKNTCWIGLEYFCKENDDFWNMEEKERIDFVSKELINMKIINSKNEILDYHIEKVEKAYPAYFDSYNEIDKIKAFIDLIPNLYCVGRNGQHRYNNMDHSIKTGFIAADDIINNKNNKKNIWNVNIENEYHEEK